MGHFSYTCPHCKRPIHDSSSVWEGLNEWMKDAVVLDARGSVIRGEYGGYGRVGDYDLSDSYGDPQVWAHAACWTAAGKPDFEEYEKPSGGTQHGGHEEEDLIPEPGKPKDEEAWAAALARRAQAIRESYVEDVMRMSRRGVRLHVWHLSNKYQGNPDNPKPAGWVVSENMLTPPGYPSLSGTYGIETEEEAKAVLKRRLAEYETSEAFLSILAEYRAIQQRRANERELAIAERVEAALLRDHALIRAGCTFVPKFRATSGYTIHGHVFIKYTGEWAASEGELDGYLPEGTPLYRDKARRQHLYNIGEEDARYTLDGEPVAIEEFLAENDEDFTLADQKRIDEMSVGETITFGGGAFATSLLKRTG